jgi:hypothetical protein
MRVTIVLITCITAIFLSSVHQSLAKYSGGTGESNNPFLIATPEDLNSIGANQTDWDKNFVLISDIDLAAYDGNSLKIAGTDYQAAFTGTFDGAGHTISNFTYNAHLEDYVGLFRSTSSSAVIKNLTLTNINVSGSSTVGGLVGYNMGAILNVRCSGAVYGEDDVGGLVGQSDSGYIRDCNSSVTVFASDWGGGGIGSSMIYTPIINCCATGNVSGSNGLGGLVNDIQWCYVINSYATGDVTGDYRIGGLVASQGDYYIMCCYATGNVQANECAGGLVGEIAGMIENSYATGDVNCATTAGGFGGEEWWGETGGIVNCFSRGKVTGTTTVGGFVGDPYTYDDPNTYMGCFFDAAVNGGLSAFGNSCGIQSVTGKTTTELFDTNTFINAGWDFAGEFRNGSNDYWLIPTGNGYPILSFQIGILPSLPSFSGGAGTKEDPYLISNVSEFNLIKDNYQLLEMHFKLLNDLDFNNVDFVPIGKDYMPFTGSFDGNKHRLCNIIIADNTQNLYQGIFSYVGTGAEISDIGVDNIDINVPWAKVGGLCGSVNGGHIIRCYVTGKINGFTDGLLTGQIYGGCIQNCLR